jgi:hypothetical protein
MSTRINGLSIAVALFVASLLGCTGPQHRTSNYATEMASHTTYAAPESTSSYTLPAADEWVCPMHPQVKQSEPGKCPICGMYLERSDKLSRTGGSSSGSGHSHSEGASSKESGHGCCGG